MSMSSEERSQFLQRCDNFFEQQRRLARSLGKIIPYRLLEFRDFVEIRLEAGRCPFCLAPVDPATFCLVYKVPIPRNGRFHLRNVEICCSSCLVAKDVLDAWEFKEVLAVIRTWPKPVMHHFLARLQAGAALVSATLPRVGTLDWFLSSDRPRLSEGDS